MHFGGDAARRAAPTPAAKGTFGWRSARNSRMARLSHTTPHWSCAGPSRRRMAQDLGLGLGLPQPDALLGERDAALLHRKPGPQAPGREILVADHERVAGRRHAKPSAIVMRRTPAINAARHQVRDLQPCSMTSKATTLEITRRGLEDLLLGPAPRPCRSISSPRPKTPALEGLSAAERSWVKAQGWSAKQGAVLLLPDGQVAASAGSCLGPAAMMGRRNRRC